MPDGLVWAIKRIVRNEDVSDSDLRKAFVGELALLSRVRHRNVIGLEGWCEEGGEQVVVMPFMRLGSVRHFTVGEWEGLGCRV